MSRRPMHVLRALVVIGVVAAIAGAASPAGHAKGISYHSLNKIQKRLISGSLAMSLTGATPTSQASDTETCGNGDDGGDEPDEAPSCPPDSYSPAPVPAVARREAGTTRPRATTAAPRTAGTTSRSTRTASTSPTLISQGRGQAQNEDVDRGRPEQFEAHRREPERLPPRRRQLRGRVLARRRQELERLHDPDRRSPAASGHSRASTGRRAATPRSPGTRGATPTSAASCSTAARGISPNPDQSSAFFVFRSTGTTAPRGTSRAATRRRSSTRAARAACSRTRQLHGGRRQRRAARSGTGST